MPSMSLLSTPISILAGHAVTALLLLGAALLAAWAGLRARERRRAAEAVALATSLQQAHDELQTITGRDVLTGLPTRTQFESLLQRAALRCDEVAATIAVLFVDLDAFKPVNDAFGHAGGDAVLREQARRLQSLTGPSMQAARIGGDQFLLMLEGRAEQAATLAQCVLACVQEPIDVDGRTVQLSASIGVALYPEHGSVAHLLAHADAAMFNAKRSGGATYAFYEPQMDSAGPDRLGLLGGLRTAIDTGQLELLYQPKIDARSGQITAAEALLRWNHPERGLISPSVLVPIAERYGLIGAIGQWVIDDACRQARAWRDAGLRMRVAVNLSAQQMRHDDFVDRLLATLARHGVRPSQLTCEITESLAMSDTRATRRTFERLRAAGVHVSIDDFGTGYSSLAYLRQLPAKELKIDRSFVMDLETSDDARAIVGAVLQMAHSLGLKVVAEGVETERQRDLLVAAGCDELQGYLFARPMPARALTAWALGEGGALHSPDFRPSLYAHTAHAELT
jgi:diguanylate cyclase (GGDEF)-like protein